MTAGKMKPIDAAHPVDIYIGQRIRHQRMKSGLSQSDLGDMIGVTFQQVRKYELGLNRISGSKLYQTSRALGVPVAFFYDGFSSEDAELTVPTNPLMTYASSPEGLRLLDAFTSVPPKWRRRILKLLIAMGAHHSASAEKESQEGPV